MKVLCLFNSTVHLHLPPYTKVSVSIMHLLTLKLGFIIWGL